MPLADDQIIGLIRAIPGFTAIFCGLATSSYRRAIHWALTIFVLYAMVGWIAAAGHIVGPLDAIPETLGMATGVVLIAALSQAIRRGALSAGGLLRGLALQAFRVGETRQTPSDRTRDTESDLATDVLLASFVHAIRRGVQPIVTATFFIAALGAAWWLFTPHSMDRWVRSDDAVACTDESDAVVIANSSSPTSRRTSTGFRVAKRSCHLIFANERVRIIRISADAAVARAFLFKDGEKKWVIVSDLAATGPVVVWPWFPDVWGKVTTDVSHMSDNVQATLGLKAWCKSEWDWSLGCVRNPERYSAGSLAASEAPFVQDEKRGLVRRSEPADAATASPPIGKNRDYFAELEALDRAGEATNAPTSKLTSDTSMPNGTGLVSLFSLLLTVGLAVRRRTEKLAVIAAVVSGLAASFLIGHHEVFEYVGSVIVYFLCAGVAGGLAHYFRAMVTRSSPPLQTK